MVEEINAPPTEAADEADKNTLELDMSSDRPTHRLCVRIKIHLTEAVRSQLSEDWIEARTKSPFPTQIYLEADPDQIATGGTAMWLGEPSASNPAPVPEKVSPYFLVTSPKVHQPRALPNKTLLAIRTPGETRLGFIAPNTRPTLLKWWAKAKVELEESLRDQLGVGPSDHGKGINENERTILDLAAKKNTPLAGKPTVAKRKVML